MQTKVFFRLLLLTLQKILKMNLMNQDLGYDKTSIPSIFAYSKKLIGHTLRELVNEDEQQASLLQGQGKGGLGQMIEELFFHYPINNDPGPDFREAGMDLKTTGLKKLLSGELQIKERLVCDIINYETIVNESFEKSLFLKKCYITLLIFYLYQKNCSKWDLRYVFTAVWKLPEKDLQIIKHDFEVIVDKIRRGEAHLLSEGDTVYLAACRKGQKGDEPRKQPFSAIRAPQRAFSLKPAYMRTVLDFIKQQGKKAVSNIEFESPIKGLVTTDELKTRSFEEIILDRFKPFYGQSYLEICKCLNVKPSKSKSRISIVANLIAANGIKGLKQNNVDNSEEFQKSGIRLKTITSFSNGRVKEDTSFENIDYEEISDENEWLDSRLFELFTSRFLFVQFQQQEGETQQKFNLDTLQLKRVFFWTMPQEDICTAEEYWQNIRKHVLLNEIEAKYFWNKGMHRKFHVRPKGRNALDLANTPHGTKARKYCYWFNSEYVTSIIEQESRK
ncbi:MAG: Sau3AI family type II restriction endonuclease [Bacteroidales bacterium]|nr:Sau3AI family type II restriction endonuclease [Bacteroidales bacterium]